MQVASKDAAELLPPHNIYWHIPIPIVGNKADNVDDRIAKAFFVTMGLVGVALVVLTAKIAVTRKK